MEFHEEIRELWRRALTPDPETTYICSLSFTKPSPELLPDDEYSPKEVVIYVMMPPDLVDAPPDHILYLKKNVRRNVFEIHRLYANADSVEVIFRGSFTKALEAINRELRKYRPDLVGRFQKCEHKPPRVDRSDCPIFRRRVEELRNKMEEKAREIAKLKDLVEAYQERLRREMEEWEQLKREMEGLA